MPEDAYTNCRFYVQIDGFTQAIFTEMSGLQVETETTECVEGGNNDFIYRLPGRTKVSNITLKSGMAKSHDLFKWYMDVAHGKIERRHVTVIMYWQGEVFQRWSFDSAFPVKWVGPQLQADSTTTSIETLELAHNGLRTE